MKKSLAYITAFLLLLIFSSKEFVTQSRFCNVIEKEVCNNCDAGSANQNAEEKELEHEVKLLISSAPLPVPPLHLTQKVFFYNTSYISAESIGIVTPPPEPRLT